MAGLLDLFGGGGGGSEDDPYADILTPAQRRQMTTQGLLAMAGAFADAGMPSRLPIPFGAALGKAAAALGTGQEAGMTAALANAFKAQQVRDLRAKAGLQAQLFGPEAQRKFDEMLRAFTNPGVAPVIPGGASAPAGTYVGQGAVAGPSGPIPSRPPWAPPVGLLGGGDTDLVAGGPPSAFRGGSGDADLTAGSLPSGSGDADLVSGGGLLAPPPNRPAAQRASLTGSEREIADNNFAGLRRPGVMAGPGAGDFQSFGSPQEGLLAVSNQLDRYASGATTGTPLTTIRQIVSTWAPPSENDTETLIRRASGVVGVSPDQPLDVANPEVKAKLTEALIRNEQGGRLPVDQSLIRQVAATGQPQGGTQGENALMRNAPFPTLANAGQGQPINWRADQANLDPNNPANYGPGSPLGMAPGQPGPPDTYIPPQRTGAAPTMQLAQYQQPGAPSSGAAPASQIPQIPVPPGADPAKFNALLLELARRNAAAEVLGMGNPYGSMLSVLQGSPQYKAAVEAATETARRGAGLPFVEPEAAAKARGGLEVDLITRNYQAQLDAANQEKKILGEARNDLTTIRVDRGNGVEEIQATRAQAVDAARGLGVPELGIRPLIPGGPTAGRPVGAPYRSPSELKLEESDIKVLDQKRAIADTARTTIQNANDLRAAIEQGVIAGAGADTKTQMLKLGQLLGITGADTNQLIANTERYIASQGKNLKEGLAGLGPPISNNDTQIAERIAGGQMTTPQGMLEILRIREKYHRQAIVDYNRMASGLPASKIIGERTINEPPTYGAQTASGPNGQRVWNKDGNWVPY